MSKEKIMREIIITTFALIMAIILIELKKKFGSFEELVLGMLALIYATQKKIK